MEESSVGKILREEREKKGMSIADAARQMRLSQRQVDALEKGNYGELPGKTFVRGFIRNYAKLLQIDAAPLLADSDVHFSSESTAPVAPKGEEIPFSSDSKAGGLHYAILALILALPLLVYEIYRENRAPKVQPEANAALSAPEPASSVAPEVPEVSQPIAQTSAPVASAPMASNPVALPVAEKSQPILPLSAPAHAEPAPKVPLSVAVPEKPAPSAPRSAAEAQAAIKMSFGEDSWVEVKDKAGKLLFSKLCKAGSEEAIGGSGPFSLVIGNAKSVKLSFRGKAVDLTPYVKVSVARLTLE